MQSILLLGHGELGTALLPYLLTLPNSTVTIGTRNPSSPTALAHPSPSLSTPPSPTTSTSPPAPPKHLAIDLTAPSSTLVPILANYTHIISASGFTQTPSPVSITSRSSVEKLTSEILAAGQLRKSLSLPPLHYFPWQWGVNYALTGALHGALPLFGAQARVRSILGREAEGKGVVWTIVSVGVFMSFLFGEGFGVVSGRGEEGEGEGVVKVRCLGAWEQRVTVTHVRDIGRVLGRVLAGDVEARNRVVYVAGDTLTYAQLADTLTRVLGREVVRETWSVEGLQREVDRDPQDGMKRYRLVFAGEGVAWDKEGTVNQKLGMQMLDVETYAKKFFGVQ